MMNSANDRINEAQEDATDEGYIIGKVVDNNDPLGIGRVKVQIPNLFDPGQSAVPWIGAHRQSPFGFGPNFGVYGSPQIGSEVRVKFQDGNAHYGLVEADEYKAAIANPKFKSPKTWGYKDPAGNELFVDFEAGKFEFTHQSGITIKYDIDGNRTTHIVNDSTETIDGDRTDTVDGNSTQTVTGDDTQTVSGNLSITVSGTATINVNGAVNLTSSTSITASAPIINLN